MRFTILTLFPEYFQSAFACSLLSRAQGQGLLQIDTLNLREFGEGKYRAVDDKPYGGGHGMVLMPFVLEAALTKLLGSVESLEADVRDFKEKNLKNQDLPFVIYLSPQGAKLDAQSARGFAGYKHLVLICGHYEGIDERALEAFVHQEVSIGDYILTGGEPAALVLIDAASRFIPGVVGELGSVENDTFEAPPEMAPGGLKYPTYTRPQQWRGREVPSVLLSGHHQEIARWRRTQSETRTKARRPDLLKKK